MRHIKIFLITILSILFLVSVTMVPMAMAETPTSTLKPSPEKLILPESAVLPEFKWPVHEVEIGSDRTLWMIADRSADPKEGNALYRCPFDETSQAYKECEKILAIDGEWQPIPLDAMAVNPQNPDHIIVGVWNAVVQSENGGSTWTPTILTYGSRREVIEGAVNDILFLGESTYLATTRGVFYSHDGRNWDRYGENLVSNVRKLAMLPANLKLGGGEALTAYGYGPAVWQYMSQYGQWIWIEIPVDTGEQSEVFYFGQGGWSDPFLTFVVREEWWEASVVILSPANRGYPQKAAASSLNRPGDSRGSRWPLCSAVSPSGLAVLGTDGGLYSSTDRGQSWQRIESFGDAQINDVMTIKATITPDLSEGKFLIGSDQGLEIWPPPTSVPISVTGAETPTAALAPAPAEPIPSELNRPVHDVEIGSDRTLWMIADRSADPKEGNALYRCPFDETSQAYKECEKILAIDGEWQPIPLDAMAVNPQNPDHIIVGVWNAVVQSENGGSTWTPTILTYGGQREVIEGAVNDILFLGESTYLATTRGVFYSHDGRNWDRYGENLVSDVRKLAMLPANLKLGGGETLTAYGHGPAVWQYMSQHGQWIWIETTVDTGEQSEVFYFGQGGWSDPFLTFVVREEWWEASVVILSPANRGYPQKAAASSLNRPGDSRGSRWPLCGAVSPSGLAVLGTDGGLYSSTDRGQSWQRIGSFGDAQINDVMTIKATITPDLSEGKFLIGSDRGLEIWPSD